MMLGAIINTHLTNYRFVVKRHPTTLRCRKESAFSHSQIVDVSDATPPNIPFSFPDNFLFAILHPRAVEHNNLSAQHLMFPCEMIQNSSGAPFTPVLKSLDSIPKETVSHGGRRLSDSPLKKCVLCFALSLRFVSVGVKFKFPLTI